MHIYHMMQRTGNVLHPVARTRKIASHQSELSAPHGGTALRLPFEPRKREAKKENPKKKNGHSSIASTPNSEFSLSCKLLVLFSAALCFQIECMNSFCQCECIPPVAIDQVHRQNQFVFSFSCSLEFADAVGRSFDHRPQRRIFFLAGNFGITISTNSVASTVHRDHSIA